MAKDLRLQVVLDAVDRATGPLKKLRQGAGKTAEAMRATRDQLKELNRQQKDLTSYRRAQAGMRNTTRQLRSLGAQQERYNQRLHEQREAHTRLKSNLTTARREYDKLAKQVASAAEPNRQLTAQLEKARIRLTSQQQAFDQSSRSIKKYRDRTRHVDDQVKRLGATQDKHRQTLRDVGHRLDEAGIKKDNASRAARELREREQRLNATLEQQQHQLKRVADKQRRLSELRERHGKAMMHTAMVGGTGLAAMAAGRRVANAGGQLVAPGIDWEAQMSTLAAVGRFQQDDPQLRALMAQSRELGGTTAYSATQVGAGQEFLLRAGMSAEAIKASMRDVLDLATANNTELARAADISSNIASAFRIDPNVEGSMTRVADVLTATASRANVNLEMLGESMKYLGAGSGLGLTLEQAAAMAGLLGNIGIQGSQAGTTLRAMMNRLANPVGNASDSIEALSLQVTDAEGNLRQIPDILRDISRATEGMGNAQQAAHLQNIFGTEAGSGMAELVRQQGTAGIDQLIQAITEAQGQNARAAGTMADNVAGDLKNLRSAWEEVGISIADTNSGALRELIQSLTTIVRRLSEWIKQNPETVATIAKMAGIVAGLAIVLGGLAATVASILGPLLIMRFLFLRTAIGLGMGAANAGLFSRALGAVGKLLGGLFLGGLKGAWVGVAFLARQVAGLLLGLRALGAILLAVGKGIMIGLLGALKATAIFLATNPIGWAIMAIAGLAFVLIKYWEPIKGFFTDLLSGIGQQFKEMWKTVESAFDDGLAGVGRLLLNWSPAGMLHEALIDSLERLGLEVPELFHDFGSFIVDGLIGGVRGGFADVRAAIRELAGNIISWFTGPLEIHSPSRVFEGFGVNIVQGIINGISGMAGALRDQVMGLAGDIAGWMQDAIGSAWASGKEIAAGIGEGVKEGAKSAGRAVREGAGAAWEAGKSTATGVANGLRDNASAAADRASDMARNTIGAARELFRTNSPSRVFRDIGRDVTAGLALGIQRHTDEPARQAAAMARRVRQAGAGLALGAVASGALAGPGGTSPAPDIRSIPIDTRPPMAAPAAGGGVTVQGGINIEIHATPGMDEQALARYVAAEVRRALDAAARDADVRRRSAFHDID